MKKLLLFLPAVIFTSGCVTTLTPHGELYTELLVPTSTVVVQERPVHVRAGHHPHRSPGLLAAKPPTSVQPKPGFPKPGSPKPASPKPGSHGHGPR